MQIELGFTLLEVGANNKLPPPAYDNSLAENQENKLGERSLAIEEEIKNITTIKIFISLKLGLYEYEFYLN